MKTLMKTGLMTLVMLVSSVLATQAFARASVPIVNVENIAIVTASGKTPTLDQVKQSITLAGAAGNWQILPAEDNKLVGTLNVRGKHTIVVTIPYTTTQYSLIYKDSINMNYELSKGSRTIPDDTPVIHPNYNSWTDKLHEAIRAELLKL